MAKKEKEFEQVENLNELEYTEEADLAVEDEELAAEEDVLVEDDEDDDHARQLAAIKKATHEAEMAEFDWDTVTNKGLQYTPEEKARLEEIYNKTFSTIAEGEV
ncbi:MAG: hypothetical protein ACP5PS_10570, partial [Bacteroidales bacterium]